MRLLLINLSTIGILDDEGEAIIAINYDQGPQIRLDEETFDDLLNAFRRAIRERFDFELED